MSARWEWLGEWTEAHPFVGAVGLLLVVLLIGVLIGVVL